MPTLTPALVARRSEIPSTRTPRSVSTHALSDTFDMMGAPMSFSRNDEIYGEGEPADYLYKVVHGAVRMYKVLNDGRRQIGAFYLPCDMFGFESGDEHASSGEAVGDVTVLVCVPPYSHLPRATATSPASFGKSRLTNSTAVISIRCS
jgi:CRP/FNR family nitrogen fixation transcriptional regulator